METVLVVQLIVGFHLHNQGIPKITCWRPRLRTIRSVVSLVCEKRISVQAFHLMVPLAFAVLSTLYARIGLGSRCNGKWAFDRRLMLMKFPVAPQSMRAVVTTICVPVTSLIGRRMVRSFGRATSTWDKLWEDNIKTTSQIKNPHHRRRWWRPYFLRHPHNKFSRSGECLQVIFPWW